MPDEKWGERPMAFVCPVEAGSDVSKESIHEFLEGRVVSYWKPDAVVTIAEIPKTSVGKFNKRALREQME
jgi:fatty-acyl-CoA synthase